MINQVVLVGRTTKDIELAYTRNNKAYTKFTLAYGDVRMWFLWLC